MCKCSFVRVACVVLGLLLAGTCASPQDSYDVGQPSGEVELKSVRSADVSLIFDSSEIIVNPGEPLNLDCGVQGQNYRYCIWESENNQIYQVEDVYSNVYNGMSKPANTGGNECGIVINAADIEHHGQWTCKVFVVGNSLVGAKNVVVTIKPTRPVLEVDNSDYMYVNTEDQTDVRCSVAAARPAVDIHWYLGDAEVTDSSEIEETPTDKGGIYKSVSTLRRTFRPDDNGKVLLCSITHKTLEAPENTSIPVNVEFKPVEQPLSTFYQISPGRDYEVRFNYSANPQPISQEWRYGDSYDSIENVIRIPGGDDHYQANYEDRGNGKYTATLVITEFTDEDAARKYLLVVQNNLGTTEYKVQLSVDPAPRDGDSETSNHDNIPPTELSVSEDELSGGAVAGIVIVLLIVVVAVVAAGYTRYRQMFCFAPKEDAEKGSAPAEEHSDTESARGTNTSHAANMKKTIGQLSQVFKKPKKDQGTKMDDVEKKVPLKDEPSKEVPQKEMSPDEKEVVYAELDLGKGEPEKKTEVKADEKTEYAQIVGTVTDNREEEKKE